MDDGYGMDCGKETEESIPTGYTDQLWCKYIIQTPFLLLQAEGRAFRRGGGKRG
jgi:hypothetical protein